MLWYYNATEEKQAHVVAFEAIVWDLDDDPDGNVQHCAAHGVTKEEVEAVFRNVTDEDVSRSSGRPVVFGDHQRG